MSSSGTVSGMVTPSVRAMRSETSRSTTDSGALRAWQMEVRSSEEASFCVAARPDGLKANQVKDIYSVSATNGQNAISKNWKVQYFDRNTDIATTGNYACITTDIPSSPALREPFRIYPNPASDMLYLSATARTIRVYNIYGIEVAHATDTDRVDVAHLPAGIYIVKADGTVAKMVKR